MDELLQEMPAVVFRGVTILPGAVTHFDINHPKAVQSVRTAMREGGRIFLVTQRDMRIKEPTEDDLYRVGLVAEIRQVIKLPKDKTRVIVNGKRRAELAYFINSDAGLRAQIMLFANENEHETPAEEEAMLRSLQEALVDYTAANPKVGNELQKHQEGLSRLDTFMDIVGNSLPLPYQKKQALLEAVTLRDRYEELMLILGQETEITQIKNEIQKKTKARIDKNQREYVLREQMKVIREELGEDDADSDAELFTNAVEALDAQEYVKERLRK